MAKTEWKRSKGTSKKAQGIITPKAPQNRRKKRVIVIPEPIKLSWWKRFLHNIFHKT